MKLFITRSSLLNFYLERPEMVLNLKLFIKSWMEKEIPSSLLKANTDLSLALSIHLSGNPLKMSTLLLTLRSLLSRLRRIRFIDGSPTQEMCSLRVKKNWDTTKASCLNLIATSIQRKLHATV
jgi:hypothetical protein